MFHLKPKSVWTAFLFASPRRKHTLNFSAPPAPRPRSPPAPGPGQYDIVDFEGPSKHYISSAVFVSNTARCFRDKFHQEIPGPGKSIIIFKGFDSIYKKRGVLFLQLAIMIVYYEPERGSMQVDFCGWSGRAFCSLKHKAISGGHLGLKVCMPLRVLGLNPFFCGPNPNHDYVLLQCIFFQMNKDLWPLSSLFWACLTN